MALYMICCIGPEAKIIIVQYYAVILSEITKTTIGRESVRINSCGCFNIIKNSILDDRQQPIGGAVAANSPGTDLARGAILNT